MLWPLAQGLELIIVIEEKRSLIEVQVREELYGSPNQPVCVGKRDEAGQWLFPVKGALDPNNMESRSANAVGGDGGADQAADEESPPNATPARSRRTVGGTVAIQSGHRTPPNSDRP